MSGDPMWAILTPAEREAAMASVWRERLDRWVDVELASERAIPPRSTEAVHGLADSGGPGSGPNTSIQNTPPTCSEPSPEGKTTCSKTGFHTYHSGPTEGGGVLHWPLSRPPQKGNA